MRPSATSIPIMYYGHNLNSSKIFSDGTNIFYLSEKILWLSDCRSGHCDHLLVW